MPFRPRAKSAPLRHGGHGHRTQRRGGGGTGSGIGNGPGVHFDMNRGAVFGDTAGPAASAPLHSGAYNRGEETERLRSCYSLFHNNKVSYHDRRSEVASKPSSMRLFRGTNEFAEDLTGQRLPLRAFAWVTETKDNYVGNSLRPTSAPAHRIVSQMDNEEPIFRKTSNQKNLDDIKLAQLNCHQGLPPSRFREGDMYQTSYSLGHRKFSRDEQVDAGSAFWDREKYSRPWLQEPVTAAAAAQNSAFELECRMPKAQAQAQVHPTEAQVSTLPHYLDHSAGMGRTENQVSYGDPYTAPEFYFEEPNRVQKPLSVHLQKTFVN